MARATLMSLVLLVAFILALARFTIAVNQSCRFQSTRSLSDVVQSQSFVLVKTADSAAADGVVAVVLSPRFLLTIAAWLPAPASSSSALFAVSAAQVMIPVKQVWLERDFGFGGSGSVTTSFNPLAVIELERQDENDELLTAELSTSLPKVESALSVVYLNRLMLRASEPAKNYTGVVLSNDDCRRSATGGGELCVQFDLPQTPVKMGFATQAGRVVGLAAGGSLADGSPVTSQTFVHFGSAPHRQFLDQVTSNSLMWDIEKASASSPSPIPSPMMVSVPSEAASSPVRVALFGADASKLPCGGVQIATDYVLTSASCVLRHNVSHVAFRGGVFAASISVASQVVNPNYNDSITASILDVAMLFAPSHKNPEPSIELDSGSIPAFATLMRLQLGETEQIQSIQVLPRANCTSVTTSFQSNATEDSGQQCVKTMPGTEDPTNRQSTNAALFRESTKKNFLVGLQPDTSSDRFLFLNKADDFINANSVGHTWRAVSSSDEDEDIIFPGAEPTLQPVTAAGVASPQPYSNAIPPAPAPPPAPLLPAYKRYVVGLRLAKTGQNFCGGVLISPLHVITAANCVSDGKAEWAAVGSSASAGASDEILRVAKGSIVVHPQFGVPHMTSNNVAILTLEHAAYSSPIAFDTTSDFADGTPATMTGYGDLNDTNSSKRIKTAKEVALPVWSKHKCAAKIPNVDDTILCAGGEAGKDACSGDAGSPLTIQSISGEELLIGIVSAGYGCGQEGVPGFYARTAPLMEFIKAYTVTTKWSSSTSGKVLTALGSAEATSATVALGASEERSSSSSPEQLPTLTPVSQKKILLFLIGTTDHINVLSKELRTRLSDNATKIALSSSEDLSALNEIIKKHNALPLNRRSDRFGTASGSGQQSSVAVACSV